MNTFNQQLFNLYFLCLQAIELQYSKYCCTTIFRIAEENKADHLILTTLFEKHCKPEVPSDFYCWWPPSDKQSRIKAFKKMFQLCEQNTFTPPLNMIYKQLSD